MERDPHDATTPGTFSPATAMVVTESHEARVGATTVHRALPRAGRRTVGAWCFADHMGPVSFGAGEGLDVGPHPHCGLHTVTWLVAGEALHRDSLASEQIIRPGQLNLMTAGHGISHAEEATRQYAGTMHGIQLWVAQPEATRHGEPAFEHHGELPRVDLGGSTATVLLGSFADVASPARTDTEIVGVDLEVRSGTSLPLRPGFEHALVVLEGAVLVDGVALAPGHLGYLGDELTELHLQPDGSRDGDGPGVRVVLLGGAPFEAPISMSWNFVGRSRDELAAAHDSWNADDGRFGTVDSRLARIPAPPPAWSR